MIFHHPSAAALMLRLTLSHPHSASHNIIALMARFHGTFHVHCTSRVYEAAEDTFKCELRAPRRTRRGRMRMMKQHEGVFSDLHKRFFLPHHIHNMPSEKRREKKSKNFNSSPSANLFFHHLFSSLFFLLLPLPKPSRGSQAIYIEFFAALSLPLLRIYDVVSQFSISLELSALFAVELADSEWMKT